MEGESKLAALAAKLRKDCQDQTGMVDPPRLQRGVDMTNPMRKIAVYAQVSTEQAAESEGLRAQWEDHWRLAATPEGRTVLAERRAARISEWKAHHDPQRAAHNRLVATTTGLTRDILTLHGPDDRFTCAGCDARGSDAENPVWPCRSYGIAAIAAGASFSMTAGDCWPILNVPLRGGDPA